MRYIIKRDGRKALFDQNKIYLAILKAFNSTGKEGPEVEEKVEAITETVVNTINSNYNRKNASVEEVQDIIEKTLISTGESDVAKNYILYRAERSRIRNSKSRLMKTLRDITFLDAKDNDVKRENANIDADTAMGTMLKYGSESAKEFYLSEVIDPRFSKAHQDGDIHIHDLDFYSLTMTCCQIDLLKLFHGGFSTGDGFIREPNSIRSYASLACIAIQANQNDQHGGQSVPNFDYAMAEGVRKSYKKDYHHNLYNIFSLFDDKLTKDDVRNMIGNIEVNEALTMGNDKFHNEMRAQLASKYPHLNTDKLYDKVVSCSLDDIKDETLQAMEALIHNLNTMHSRAGAQVPFSSLNYGTDTSQEGRLAITCLLDATLRGLGDGQTPIFPIQIFKVKEGVNYYPTDPNYDLLQKAIYVSGRRLFPNFSFLDAPFNLQYYKPGDYHTEATYMGCRTRVIGNVDKDKEIVTGRGNLSFTSINLPRIAIEHKDIDEFFKRLDELMDLVKDQLLERYEIQCGKKVYNFPFLMGQGIWLDSDKLKYTDEVRPVLRHGTLSIGFIGLAECLVALTGKHHGESAESQELGLKIIGHMREKCDKYSEEYNLNFSLLATPAEGLSGRFVRIDKKKYGIIPGVTDRDFYTNSFHVPVYYPISIYNKIKTEGPYNAFTNAGHITYVEVDGDIAKNPEAFEKIIRCMHDNGVGYGSVNHPIDRDPICGYNGIINNSCPKCGREEDEVKFERIRRITGYLVGTLDRFNTAKAAEVRARVKHGYQTEAINEQKID